MSAERLAALSRWPLAVAPMAGGPSTPALVTAALEAGAFAFVAGGYRSADALMAEMAEVREATHRPFGVNLFVPGEPTTSPEALARYLVALEVDQARLGVALGDPVWDDDDYPAKLEAVLAQPPALVSFTFGCPAPDTLAALAAAGSLVAVTVTNPAEARAVAALGVDALCLQGCEAGAHRGHFANVDRPDQDRTLASLLASIRRVTRLPLIAAGGLSTPADLRWALSAGATWAQFGTAFLRCPESGANATYKAALADVGGGRTAVTRAYSGRRARGLVNRFMEEHHSAPAAYPEINNATRPLRAAAAAAGDAGGLSLYAGTGVAGARDEPVAQVVERLVSGLPL